MPKVLRSMSQDSMSGSRKGDTVFDRDIEDVCVQKLENGDPHLLVASVAELSHQPEPLFTFQFLLGDSLGDIQELLRDQALEFSERLLLENADVFPVPSQIRIFEESTPDTL